VGNWAGLALAAAVLGTYPFLKGVPWLHWSLSVGSESVTSPRFWQIAAVWAVVAANCIFLLRVLHSNKAQREFGPKPLRSPELVDSAISTVPNEGTSGPLPGK